MWRWRISCRTAGTRPGFRTDNPRAMKSSRLRTATHLETGSAATICRELRRAWLQDACATVLKTMQIASRVSGNDG